MKHSIHLAEKRARLAPRKEPYWQRDEVMINGERVIISIGFRKGRTGGFWLFRQRKKPAGYDVKALGNVIDYDEAKAAIATRLGNPSASSDHTVQDAFDAKLEQFSRERKHNPKAIRRLIQQHALLGKMPTPDGTPISKISLTQITTEMLEAWTEDNLTITKTGKARTESSIARMATDLKSALNVGAKKWKISDAEWRHWNPGSKKLKAVDTYFDKTDRIAILSALDSRNPAKANFVRAMFFTGARCTELYEARVRDFKMQERILWLGTMKGDGELKRRKFHLTQDAYDFFTVQVHGKELDDYLLTQADGSQWTSRDANFTEIPDVVPASATMTWCRHTAISLWLSVSMIDVSSVAKMAGTSVRMIEGTYANFIPDENLPKLEKVDLF